MNRSTLTIVNQMMSFLVKVLTSTKGFICICQSTEAVWQVKILINAIMLSYFCQVYRLLTFPNSNPPDQAPDEVRARAGLHSVTCPLALDRHDSLNRNFRPEIQGSSEQNQLKLVC